MFMKETKTNQNRKAAFAAADSKRGANCAHSGLDFYMYEAMPSVSWTQDVFKTEQR